LITHEPHHGGVVAQLDYNAMVELYHMHEVLEGTAAF
jgi:DNA-binding GntR family transcriptional regulator